MVIIDNTAIISTHHWTQMISFECVEESFISHEDKVNADNIQVVREVEVYWIIFYSISGSSFMSCCRRVSRLLRASLVHELKSTRKTLCVSSRLPWERWCRCNGRCHTVTLHCSRVRCSPQSARCRWRCLKSSRKSCFHSRVSRSAHFSTWPLSLSISCHGACLRNASYSLTVALFTHSIHLWRSPPLSTRNAKKITFTRLTFFFFT